MGIEEKHCKPCDRGTPPLNEQEENELLQQVENWELDHGKPHRLRKEFTFDDFKDSMEFVNKIAAIANEEGHHPDISISYNEVEIELTTHAIDGLSENDFIMAGKIDTIEQQVCPTERAVLTVHITAARVLSPAEYAELKHEFGRIVEQHGIHHTTVEVEWPDEVCRIENDA